MQEQSQRFNFGREITYETVSYGMMVEVLRPRGYHGGVKVQFFNKKGVLVGNFYKFVPYEDIRLREDYKGDKRQYQRFFLNKSFEKTKQWAFIGLLRFVSWLIRFTQSKMD